METSSYAIAQAMISQAEETAHARQVEVTREVLDAVDHSVFLLAAEVGTIHEVLPHQREMVLGWMVTDLEYLEALTWRADKFRWQW